MWWVASRCKLCHAVTRTHERPRTTRTDINMDKQRHPSSPFLLIPCCYGTCRQGREVCGCDGGGRWGGWRRGGTECLRYISTKAGSMVVMRGITVIEQMTSALNEGIIGLRCLSLSATWVEEASRNTAPRTQTPKQIATLDFPLLFDCDAILTHQGSKIWKLYSYFVQFLPYSPQNSSASTQSQQTNNSCRPSSTPTCHLWY